MKVFPLKVETKEGFYTRKFARELGTSSKKNRNPKEGKPTGNASRSSIRIYYIND